MTSASSQIIRTRQNEKRSQDRIIKALTPWIQEIVSSYRVGDTQVDPESIPILTQALRRAYIAAAKDVLRIDIRQFKQFEEPLIDEVVFKGISTALNQQFTHHLAISSQSITQTASKWVASASAIAVTEEITVPAVRRILVNHLTNQRLTIAVTESLFVVETTRRTAVVTVTDPLRNTLEQIVQLIEAGDMNAAVRLSRAVDKLTRLPLSVSQGEVVRKISDIRDRLTTPLVQGETVANLREQAGKLGKNIKKWLISGFNTRETHQGANGQEQPIEQPFQVGGSLLQYPGDASLGAGLDNIVNCHCVTEYA